MADLDSVESRKWQLTINNPLDKGFSHENIVSLLSSVHGASYYWCLCDEEGDECFTLHTHIFIYRKSPIKASRLQSLFPNCHREKCFGSPPENRAYILKDGDKFNKDSSGHYHFVDSKGKLHEGINFSDTFLESGTCPEEHQGVSSADELLLELIQQGKSLEQIFDAVPSAYKHLDKIERVRSIFRDKAFVDSWRDLHVVYISGKTGIGKTRSVMDKFGYGNVYRVTDYKHPFDLYNAEDVLLFEEFRSQLPLGDMLNYLDGYPLRLPCRYFDRQACFTKVYIVSNIPVDEQYNHSDRESRSAFFRRIHEVIEYNDKGIPYHYNSVSDFIHKNDWWIDCDSDCPEYKVKDLP